MTPKARADVTSRLGLGFFQDRNCDFPEANTDCPLRPSSCSGNIETPGAAAASGQCQRCSRGRKYRHNRQRSAAAARCARPAGTEKSNDGLRHRETFGFHGIPRAGRRCRLGLGFGLNSESSVWFQDSPDAVGGGKATRTWAGVCRGRSVWSKSPSKLTSVRPSRLAMTYWYASSKSSR